MITMVGLSDRHQAVSAAVRRFPQFEPTIPRLMDQSESFRDICEELADAASALSKVDEAPPALREARRAEWQELVDRLVKEVGAELRNDDAAVRLRLNPPPAR
ncbi:hypothetical protein [Mesorhizobium sp. M0772]|uniref:hypothetical protein n=1 Tax=Mesorhizobium sp. M0772 TaxID=2956998 RepID=UPI0033351383